MLQELGRLVTIVQQRARILSYLSRTGNRQPGCYLNTP
jgi:hypothetical protein